MPKTEKLSLEEIEERCEEFIKQELNNESDSAHDIHHILRVVKSAKEILAEESADCEIVIPAAWLHDCVILPKDHPDRKRASAYAAKKAGDFLSDIDFPLHKIEEVKHAVEAHSFSAGITPETMEAKIVQDADRLDAIGAIGIARCLMVGGKLDRALYNPDDPLSENRAPDDSTWTIDHFYEKLFKLPEKMHTNAAKREAKRRVKFMEEYLRELKREV
ncbi:MAG: HD domain-containing protein [Balneolaceae bacterium]|nr:HD domain-containing protein [Balneolaceae bacterium]MDR9407291.1 HD domain-containing protein [Balneolaceae bacterium]